MEERHSQVRVGAGLEESRLNQEFLDFIKKWSTPTLLVLAVLAVGFWYVKRQKQAHVDRTDDAFHDLEALRDSLAPSPESLGQVAEEYKGVAAVPALAHLEAGDSLMFSLQTGLKAGVTLKPDGTLESPDDALTDADRASILTQAERAYQEAVDEASKKSAMMPIRLGALFGLATVAESREDFTKARAIYDQIVKVADATAFEAKARVARQRIEKLGTLKDLPPLVSEAQLPKLPPLPGAEAPAVLPPGITIEPMPGPPGPPGPPPADAPAPAPSSTPSAPPATKPQ